MSLRAAIFFSSIALLAACGSPTNTPDARVDVSTDLSFDASVDASTDGALDAIASPDVSQPDSMATDAAFDTTSPLGPGDIVVELGVTPSDGMVQSVVTANATGSRSGHPIVEYALDWGDGRQDRVSYRTVGGRRSYRAGIANHQYTAAGTYTVTCAVADDHGFRNSTSTSITLHSTFDAMITGGDLYSQISAALAAGHRRIHVSGGPYIAPVGSITMPSARGMVLWADALYSQDPNTLAVSLSNTVTIDGNFAAMRAATWNLNPADITIHGFTFKNFTGANGTSPSPGSMNTSSLDRYASHSAGEDSIIIAGYSPTAFTHTNERILFEACEIGPNRLRGLGLAGSFGVASYCRIHDNDSEGGSVGGYRGTLQFSEVYDNNPRGWFSLQDIGGGTKYNHDIGSTIRFSYAHGNNNAGWWWDYYSQEVIVEDSRIIANTGNAGLKFEVCAMSQVIATDPRLPRARFTAIVRRNYFAGNGFSFHSPVQGPMGGEWDTGRWYDPSSGSALSLDASDHIEIYDNLFDRNHHEILLNSARDANLVHDVNVHNNFIRFRETGAVPYGRIGFYLGSPGPNCVIDANEYYFDNDSLTHFYLFPGYRNVNWAGWRGAGYDARGVRHAASEFPAGLPM